MAVGIVKVHTVDLPALRLIGKQCNCEIHKFVEDWAEWIGNGWFDQLEKLGAAPENGDRYLGVTDNNGGYWIGLLFPPGTPVPDGFEHTELPSARYAFLQFEGKKDKELLGVDGINLIVEEMRKRSLTPVPLWSGWCIERYNRPVSSDKNVKILLECLYEMQ
ncbi:MAG: GyrI-like domain-containing protein [Firmicutes bacterium]|nr:GyrI-like domain-containing protein [Bacillota bacterium]